MCRKRDLAEVEALYQSTYKQYELYMLIVLDLVEKYDLNLQDLIDETNDKYEDNQERDKIHDENLEYTRRCKNR